MRRLVLLALTLGTLAAACGGAAPTPPSPQAQATPRTDASGTIVPILATTVLRVGSQRVAFLLVTSDALVTEPTAAISTTHVDGDGRGETAEASFYLWPYGLRGAYATELTFDKPGRWRLDITIGGGEVRSTQLFVDVAEGSPIPDVGELPPFAANKTLASVERIAQLTSDPTPDPELYLLTIPEAIITERPTVLVFATPALCTSPTCGPQVDTVSELRERHPAEANFIHVEIYDNPDEIQGDLDRAVFSPVVETWGFPSVPGWFNESWTYILAPDGRIAHRFEGFASLEELEAALADVL